MHVVIGGASGFLGVPLTAFLRERGHRVTVLVRSGGSDEQSSRWDPAAGRIDQGLIDEADAVVNLSGAPVAHWPWTESYKRTLLQSRVSSTATIAAAVATAPTPPILISASGMSAYGSDRGAELLTEQSSPGDGILPNVVHHWEAATQPAVAAGARVCFVRTSLVLDRSGGTLKTLLPLYRLGLGGRLADGGQYFSVISHSDWIRGVTFLLEHDSAAGPFNFANPHPTTNAEFNRQLAAQLHRPAFMRVPRFAIRTALGSLSTELLGSLRVMPEHLLAEGFSFEHPDLASTLRAALS